MAENFKVISFCKSAIKFIDTYGAFKIIFSCMMMLFISYTTYLSFNPNVLFDRYSEYEEKKHTDSFNYRMESTPIVQSILDRMIIETGGIRSFVIEMHNGKYNSAGLSFNYGALTYESLADSIESVHEDYADFTLDRYALLTRVYKMGSWCGNINDLKKIDKRLALKLESNDAKYLALAMIYGKKNDIGFIGITFKDESDVDKDKIKTILTKYASKVSPYLDGERVKGDL